MVTLQVPKRTERKHARGDFGRGYDLWYALSADRIPQHIIYIRFRIHPSGQDKEQV